MMPGEWDFMKRVGLGLPDFGGQIPMPQMDLSRPESLLQSTRRGLGSRMFPFPEAAQMGANPKQMQDMQRQAMRMMGLGMLANTGQGPGSFGKGLTQGFEMAHGTVGGAMQRAYENAMKARQEQRAIRTEDRQDAREERMLDHQQWLEGHSLEREKVADQRYAEERNYRTEQDKLNNDYRAKLFELQKDRADQGTEARVTDRGLFEKGPDGQWKLVPGTEPTGVAGRPIPQGMANDLKTNATVIGQIDKLLPQLRTPDGKGFDQTASGAFGSRNAMIDMLTPDAISDNVKNTLNPSGTDLRATVTNLNSFIVKERNGAAVTVAEFARQRGFLPTDKDNIETVEKKLSNLRSALASEQQYILDFAESQGYRPPPATVRQPGAGLGQAGGVRKSVGGRNYVQIGGQWYEDDGTAPGQ
jgi:hypothetical protein